MDGAPARSATAELRVEGLTVFVRGLEIQAGIGVYDHEHGRLQPLIIGHDRCGVLGQDRRGVSGKHSGRSQARQSPAGEVEIRRKVALGAGQDCHVRLLSLCGRDFDEAPGIRRVTGV